MTLDQLTSEAGAMADTQAQDDATLMLEYHQWQDRELARMQRKWDAISMQMYDAFLKLLTTVEYEYVEEPVPRPRRKTQLLGTVG